MDNPQLDLRYFAKFSSFLIAVTIAPSTSFCSEALDSGCAVLAFGFPSSKNSSSADCLPPFDSFAKKASFTLEAAYERKTNQCVIRRRLIEQAVIIVMHNTYRVRKGDLSRSSDDIGLVHPTKRYTVDFVWTGDEKEPRFKLLEEDHSLASETTRE